MSDDTTEVPETEEHDDAPTTAAEDPRVTKANREAATYRRELRAAQAELKKLREANQTGTEKALVEAEQRGKATALTQVGARLARAELKATAAGKVDTATLDGFLEYADLTKFVGDDGEPDMKAIDAAVKKLGGGRPADFDGGARTTAAGKTDMNSLIRRAAGVT